MRLIASFSDEKKAYALYLVLLKANIESIYEPIKNSQGKVTEYDVWVVSEEDFDKALELYQPFIDNPQKYIDEKLPELENSLLSEDPSSPIEELKIGGNRKPLMRIRLNAPVTRWLIFICIFAFFWMTIERATLIKKHPNLIENTTFNPIYQRFLYDFPAPFEKLYQFFIDHPNIDEKEPSKWSIKERIIYKKIIDLPVWRGFYETIVKWPEGKNYLNAPMFTKIAEGEYWRIWSPLFLHGNFLHILFNMLWLYLLGKEVELKIGKWRYLWMMLFIGAISNTAQYLMSGYSFLGYSGIICGLAGFVWVRERAAPWEGYTVSNASLAFLFIFVLGMVVLQVIAFVMSKMNLGQFSVSQLGNTAHVVGLACGCILAKVPLFYRLKP